MGSIRSLKTVARHALKIEAQQEYLITTAWFNSDEAQEIALEACRSCYDPPQLKTCGSGLDGYCNAQRQHLEEEIERMLNGLDQELA